MSLAHVIEAHALRRHYTDQPVLVDVSLSVGEGERVALMGPSGSGKTTLLNCLGGVDRPDSGEIILLGRKLNDLSGNDLAHLRRTKIGTIFQFFHLLPTLTVFENIELPLQLTGLSRSERVARITPLLERVGLTARGDAFPDEMSGGEQQRVAVARALAHRPALILADEPTGNLDSVNGAAVLQLLRELTDETRTALLLVTHSAEAAAICHRTIHLRDGRIERIAAQPAPTVNAR